MCIRDRYRDIFSKAGTVFQLGQDNVKVFDWKSAATATVKKPVSYTHLEATNHYFKLKIVAIRKPAI